MTKHCNITILARETGKKKFNHVRETKVRAGERESSKSKRQSLLNTEEWREISKESFLKFTILKAKQYKLVREVSISC